MAGPEHEMADGVSWLIALVIGRVLVEPNAAPMTIDDDAVLLIKRKNVTIGCTPGDAGVPSDAVVMPDAPIDASPDAGIDAGVTDAGVNDGGIDGGMDAGCTMIPGDAVTMIWQPYLTTDASGARFAILLVTPSRPFLEVKTNVFEPLASVTAPRTVIDRVEVEDPTLGTQCSSYNSGCGGGGGCVPVGGGGGWSPPGIDTDDLGDGGVIIETIGPYEIVRAQPADRTQLAGWLDQLGYMYLTADLDAVEPYIARGYTVVAVRIAVVGAQDASMMPLALTWASSELRVPASLARAAAGTALTVYVMAEGTYTFPGARIAFADRTDTGEISYLTRNELVLASMLSPDDDPIAMRVMPDLFYEEVVHVTEEVRVPVTKDCSQSRSHDEDSGCCSDCSTRQRTRFDLGLIVIAVAFVLRRRRRR